MDRLLPRKLFFFSSMRVTDMTLQLPLRNRTNSPGIYQSKKNQLVLDRILPRIIIFPLFSPTVNNTIYEMALADDEFFQLPKIDQSQITRGKFIGSGAFGEVFEGIATGLDNPNITGNVDNSSSTNVSKVAIKTLKKRESSIGKRNMP